MIRALTILAAAFVMFFFHTGEGWPQDSNISITDAWGRHVTIPSDVERIICSGPGCLRYAVYLQALDKVVAVDDIEKSRRAFEARPYFLAHPELAEKPLFGEFRGRDNPELILLLEPKPQVIFKTYADAGYNPDELQAKTGIPVVVLNYGDLTKHREDMEEALALMGKILKKESRAKEVIDFFEASICDLKARTLSISQKERPTCFVGGIAHKGPHGFTSTELAYPPFLFTNVKNIASAEGDSKPQQVNFSKEKIIELDPQYIFVDLATLQAGEAGALSQLKNEACFSVLSAVRAGRVYGLLPYNWYTINYGSVLADAYFVGSVCYPECFKDTDPERKADEIYEFLVGKPVFSQMNASFNGLAFTQINLNALK